MQTHNISREKLNGEQYIYLDSTLYNDRDTAIPCNMSFQRNDIFPFSSDNYQMSVIRFNIDSQLISQYIPYIRTDNNDLPQNYNSIPGFTVDSATMLPPQGGALQKDATSLYYEISVFDVVSNLTRRFAGYLNWFPFNLVPNLDTNFDRTTVLKNPYYHSYSSLYILSLLQDQLTASLTQLSNTLFAFHSYTFLEGKAIRIIKNTNNTYSLLLPQALYSNPGAITDFKISFNDDLLLILPFDSNPLEYRNLVNKNITINVLYIDTFLLSPQTYGGNSYYVINTLNGSSYLLPWNAISMTSNNFPVSGQLLDNNTQTSGQLFTNQTKIMTDYLMITDNADGIYQIITYQPSNYVRWINLRNSNVTTYDITPLLNTSDGNAVGINLLPKTSFSIKILFKHI